MNAAVPLKRIPVLKLILVIRNKSVQDLATFMGLYREQVSPWVNGRSEPDRSEAQKIANYLKWDLSEIWEDAVPTVTKSRSPKRKVGKAKLVTEDALKLSDPTATTYAPIEKQRRLRVVEDLDPDLELIEDVSEADDRIEIGVYPESVAATALDRLDPDDEIRKVWAPARLRKLWGAKLRAVEVSGRSMVSAGITPGSIVFWRMSTKHKDGSIAIVEQDGGVTLKRIRGKTAVAESDRKYPNITLGDDARHIGIVIAVHRP